VLSEGLREPSRPRWALHGAGGVGWAVEAPDGLDAGVGAAMGTPRGGRLPGGWQIESHSAPVGFCLRSRLLMSGTGSAHAIPVLGA
jgi:hypothetical protein